MSMELRPAHPHDFPAVLGLNHESVHFLSPLTSERLARLHADAALHLVAGHDGQVAAFVLAFREHAEYVGSNYRWFAERYPRFLYVDRVVVGSTLRGQGAGRQLYEHVFFVARRDEVPLVCCEFDIDPPNPASAAFHARFGFSEVGRQAVADGRKQVSMQVAHVADRDREP